MIYSIVVFWALCIVVYLLGKTLFDPKLNKFKLLQKVGTVFLVFSISLIILTIFVILL
jgi:hypothetical protein